MFFMVAGATHLYAHADHGDDDGVCVACQVSAAAAVKIAPEGPPSIAPIRISEATPVAFASIAVSHPSSNNRSRGPPARSHSV
ncbi:hypothetical protein [Hyphococcus sp.]|uniref:hypothetical protein n=1 Tax=Hyphococcus sp. TaxID=2038636 RepID=UPI0035C6D914